MSDEDRDESQAVVRDLFRTVFTAEAPLGAARDAEPLGFDTALWGHMQAVGAPGLGLPESAGGGGVGLAELVVMAHEVGRAIASVPLVEHTVATRALARLGHDVSDLADGSAIATLAVRPAVDGRWSLAPAGAIAHAVIGEHDGRTVLVRTDPPGQAPANHACAPLAHRTVLEPVDLGPADALDDAIDEWRLLTAAALVGIAATALELGVAYATDRLQFGVPIGSFQAVQHQLADLPGLIDGAELLAHEAAWALDGDLSGPVDIGDERIEDGSTLALMAFLFAADTASLATARSLHVHGGYGFSEEYDIQLLYRRARGWALVAGDLGGQYQRLADRLVGVAS